MKTINKLRMLVLRVQKAWDEKNELGIPDEFTSDAEVESVSLWHTELVHQ